MTAAKVRVEPIYAVKKIGTKYWVIVAQTGQKVDGQYYDFAAACESAREHKKWWRSQS